MWILFFNLMLKLDKWLMVVVMYKIWKRVNELHSAPLNFMVGLALWMDLSPLHHLIASYAVHLETNCLTQLFHILTRFIIQYQKIICISIVSDPFKDVSWGVVKLTVAHKVLPTPNSHLTALILSLTTNIVSCFLWKYRLILLIFEKTTAKHSHMNNHGLLLVLSDRNDVPLKSA